MKKNSLSRLILGALILLVLLLLAAPFVLRTISNRISKVNTPPVGNNMEITSTPTPTLASTTSTDEKGKRVVLQSANKANTTGEMTITRTADHWEISINTTLPPLNDATYGIWLVRNIKPTSRVFLGPLTDNKGGWGADFTSTTDLGAYQQIWITIQTNTKTPGTKVLVGNL